MLWVPLVAWIAALVVAGVVIAFCAYELTWKIRRLRAEAAQLAVVSERLATVQQQIADTRERATRARAR